MRIAILSSLEAGGAATGASRIAWALTEAGYECSCFVLESSSKPHQVNLMNNHDAFWLSNLFNHWKTLTKKEALEAYNTELFSDSLNALNVSSLPDTILNADIILIRWIAGMIFSPLLLKSFTGKKIVWNLPDTNAFTGGCHYTGHCDKYQTRCFNCPLLLISGADDISAKCFELKEKLYPLLNPYIITPSSWLANEVKKSVLLRNYNVKTIPHPLNSEIFKPPYNRYELRKNMELSDKDFVILFGCDDLNNPRKKINILFEALTLLSEKSQELPIIVMLYGHGTPSDLPFPVRNFGYISNFTFMIELYGAADIFIHTAVQEAFGNTLCEAQACGTPTLCFDVGGCPETMLPGETGFLLSETTSEALAEKLYEIIINRDRLPAMRDKARSFAEKQFNPKSIAAAYTEIFEKAQPAPGLKTTDPLYAELVQNQIASLASIFHNNYNALRQEHNALRQEHNALREEHNALRQNLRHPLKYIFRKVTRS